MGIGVHIARSLARRGVHLALAARSLEGLERTRQEAMKLGVRALAIGTDVSVGSDLAVLVDRAEDQLGAIDILVNNAGLEMISAYNDLTAVEIDYMVRVNLLAPMLLTRKVLPGMLERNRGHVVNMSSMAGRLGNPYHAVYAATKAGLILFTQSLREEFAGSAVSFSAICPGLVRGAGGVVKWEAQGLRTPSNVRMTTPRKVAQAVIKAIEDNSAEVIVSPGPMRLFMVLGTVFPSFPGMMQRRSGALDWLRQATELARDKTQASKP
jgi:short-subunit dehydrogenase